MPEQDMFTKSTTNGICLANKGKGWAYRFSIPVQIDSSLNI